MRRDRVRRAARAPDGARRAERSGPGPPVLRARWYLPRAFARRRAVARARRAQAAGRAPAQKPGRDRRVRTRRPARRGRSRCASPGPMARVLARATARGLDPRTGLRPPRHRDLPCLLVNRAGGTQLRPVARRADRAERSVAPERPRRAVRCPSSRPRARRPRTRRPGDRAQTRGEDGKARAAARTPRRDPRAGASRTGGGRRRAGRSATGARHRAVLSGVQRARRNRALAARSRDRGAGAVERARPIRTKPRIVRASLDAGCRRAGHSARAASPRRATRDTGMGSGRDRSQVRLGLPARAT